MSSRIKVVEPVISGLVRMTYLEDIYKHCWLTHSYTIEVVTVALITFQKLYCYKWLFCGWLQMSNPVDQPEVDRWSKWHSCQQTLTTRWKWWPSNLYRKKKPVWCKKKFDIVLQGLSDKSGPLFLCKLQLVLFFHLTYSVWYHLKIFG